MKNGISVVMRTLLEEISKSAIKGYKIDIVGHDMQRILPMLLVLLFSFENAWAKTPPEVIGSYKAYKVALDDRDFDLAAKHAYTAWQTAESMMGDHKTTGDLAQNYADLGHKADLKYSDIKKALVRSIALTEDPEVKMQREVTFAIYATKNKKSSDFTKRFDHAVTFAETNDLSNSTFLGELYTIRAEVAAKNRRKKDIAEYSRKALDVFEKSDDNYATVHPWVARLYSGYAYEYEEDLVPALMDYQVVMQNTEQALPKDHPFVMKALGRWMSMRKRVNRAGLTEEAEAAGMCECWPFDKERNENVRPIKRTPPNMPSKAWISGFSIVEFDLDDAGNTINQRILESWPEDVFDRSTRRALSKWEYSPRTAEETDQDRTDLVVTMWYRLSDQYGNLIE